MTQRERQASGAVSAARPPGSRAAPSRVESAPAVPSRVPLWEDLYPNLTPAQQNEMLTLARRQGVVYATQLPPTPGNGPDRARQFLTHVFTTRPLDLAPVGSGPLDILDTDLDAAQRDAVSRALHTPDICLIQGLPGTGKSRVVAELVTQAARRGERVLLLSSVPASLDRILELVGTRDGLCPVRCLARDERPELLSPAVRALTFSERVRELGENALEESRRQTEAAEDRCRRRRADEDRLTRCRELSESWAQIEAQSAAVEVTLSQAEAEVEREADDTSAEWAAPLATCAEKRRATFERIDAALGSIETRRTDQMQALQAVSPQVEEVRPLAEAKQNGRWWTGTWWRATFAGNAEARLTDLETRRIEAEKALTLMEEEATHLEEERARAEQNYQAERRRLIQDEITRRKARLEERGAALQHDRNLIQEKWQLTLRELDATTPPPAAMTVAAVQASLESWRNLLDEEERQAIFAREWADGLASLRDSLPQRLAAHANLVASASSSLPFDERFGDSSGITFDLLVLEQAHLITESEFAQTARRARRWVLVGEPETENEPARPAERESRDNDSRDPRRRGAAPSRPRVTAAPRLFPRLWQHLHCDPRRLPYAWFQEGPRFGCRLRPVAEDQRQYLESEPVVDFPDVELRILDKPRSEPVLAEVLFPATMTLAQAKEFIFKELQELPVRATVHSLTWAEEPERLVLRLSDIDAGAQPVSLETGVREYVVGTSFDACHTCRLEFDRSAGWHRPRVEEWLREHLGVCDLGRTSWLDVPHRSRPELAAFLSDLLFADAYRVGVPGYANGRSAAVEFVPVPPLTPDAGKSDPARRGNGTPPRAKPSRGGAGLELDLSDPRHRDRLPSELRPELPADGLVNYLEAQAVVRHLESLAANRAAGERPSVGILALYPAQAELIRCLVKRTPALSEALDLRIDVPSGFRERDCGIILVSLTRSHSHRAVTFGEGPQVLTLALTRARDRLLLFGDAGTLARRAQWEGPVDHLDESAAARERDLVCRLLRYLSGEGTHPRIFHLHESGRA